MDKGCPGHGLHSSSAIATCAQGPEEEQCSRDSHFCTPSFILYPCFCRLQPAQVRRMCMLLWPTTHKYLRKGFRRSCQQAFPKLSETEENRQFARVHFSAASLRVCHACLVCCTSALSNIVHTYIAWIRFLIQSVCAGGTGLASQCQCGGACTLCAGGGAPNASAIRSWATFT